MKPALELKGIWKGFGHGPSVLKGLSLSLTSGEVVILIGENGAGKTTTFEIACGTYRPDRGEILVHGQPMKRQAPEVAVAYGLLRMRQSPARFGSLPISDAVLIGKRPSLYSRFLPWPSRNLRRALWSEVRTHAAQLFRECPFLNAPDVPLGALSYGQQRIVDFLRVHAACGPRSVVLLDEPFAGIQPRVAETIWQMTLDAAATGSAVLVIEHEHEMARYDQVRRVHLREGSIH